MSEISEMMPLVNALLKSGQMPSADQIRRLLVVVDKQDAEIERLRKIEKAAATLKFSAYPAHGTGFVTQVHAGNINDLEAALAAE